jgi:hypothetical protein
VVQLTRFYVLHTRYKQFRVALTRPLALSVRDGVMINAWSSLGFVTGTNHAAGSYH